MSEQAATPHDAKVKGKRAVITRAADFRPPAGQKVSPMVKIAKHRGDEKTTLNDSRFYAQFDNFDADLEGRNAEDALKKYVARKGGGRVELLGHDDEDGRPFVMFSVEFQRRGGSGDGEVRVFAESRHRSVPMPMFEATSTLSAHSLDGATINGLYKLIAKGLRGVRIVTDAGHDPYNDGFEWLVTKSFSQDRLGLPTAGMEWRASWLAWETGEDGEPEEPLPRGHKNYPGFFQAISDVRQRIAAMHAEIQTIEVEVRPLASAKESSMTTAVTEAWAVQIKHTRGSFYLAPDGTMSMISAHAMKFMSREAAEKVAQKMRERPSTEIRGAVVVQVSESKLSEVGGSAEDPPLKFVTDLLRKFGGEVDTDTSTKMSGELPIWFPKMWAAWQFIKELGHAFGAVAPKLQRPDATFSLPSGKTLVLVPVRESVNEALRSPPPNAREVIGDQATYQLKDYLGPNGRYTHLYDQLPEYMEFDRRAGLEVSLLSVPGFPMALGLPGPSKRPWYDGQMQKKFATAWQAIGRRMGYRVESTLVLVPVRESMDEFSVSVREVPFSSIPIGGNFAMAFGTPKRIASEIAKVKRELASPQHDEEDAPRLKKKLLLLQQALAASRPQDEAAAISVPTKWGNAVADEAWSAHARARLAALKEGKVEELASVATYLYQRALDDPHDADARTMAVQALIVNHEPLKSARISKLLGPPESTVLSALRGDVALAATHLEQMGFAPAPHAPALSGRYEDNSLAKLSAKMRSTEDGWVKAAERTERVKEHGDLDDPVAFTGAPEEHSLVIFRTPTGHAVRLMAVDIIAGEHFISDLRYLVRAGF